MYSIYKHTNKENGKVYIGMTSKSVEERWGNGHNYKHNPTFYNDIIKYGWDNFIHEIICTCDTYEKAYNLETQYIQENINNCYNISKTYSTVPLHSEPTTKPCTVPSTDHSAPRHFQWHKVNEYIPLIEKPKGRHSCPISQYSLDGKLLNVFASSKEASLSTNVNQADIIGCCKGKRATGKKVYGAGGYIWRYNIDKLSEFPQKHSTNKKVCQYDEKQNLICTYDSALQAALENNISYTKMTYLCSGRASNQFALGYYWRYEE